MAREMDYLSSDSCFNCTFMELKYTYWWNNEQTKLF